MKSKALIAVTTAILLSACVTEPRSADNVTLARVAKDYIGVGSIDEIELSNIQKMPVQGSGNILGETHYRFFADTAKGKKFICDVTLWGLGADGKPFKPDEAKCETR